MEGSTQKQYDLEERTFKFAQDVRIFVRKIQKDIPNMEDGKQVVRSSGSVGANYIEANNSLGQKDKCMKMRICLKEARESGFWLRLIGTGSLKDLEDKRNELIQESRELVLIFASILQKLTMEK